MAEHARQTTVRQNLQNAVSAHETSAAAARQDLRSDNALYELQRTLGNQAMQRSLQRKCASCQHDTDEELPAALQTKLAINQPGDVFEQEADRVADAVMSGGSAPATAQRTCACGGTCDDCQRKAEVLQRASAGSDADPAAGTAPSIVHEVLRSPGEPLDGATRSFMEARLGADFRHVRVHTDAQASESARAINARAYTVAKNLVFASGEYAPTEARGKKLLAHELTHVIQQDENAGGVHLQRVCSKTDLGPPPCKIDRTLTPSSTRFLFNVDCDEFAPGEKSKLSAFAAGLSPKSTVSILGLASSDGPPRLNDTLSCLRRDRAVAVVKLSAPPTVTIALVGATGGIGPSGDINFRAASVSVSTPPVKSNPKCGPDATDWFVLQVNTALSDKDVRVVKTLLSAADIIALSRGTSANTFAEAAAAAAVEAQEVKLALTGVTPPPRTGAIVGQLAAGDVSEKAALGAPGAAFRADPFHPLDVTADFAAFNLLIAAAALSWKALVDHHARYDFKNHADSMDQPHSAHCPDADCPPTEHGTITLCPGATSSNCYESDLPGNLFYAFIGRFIGWSELTLQLGSEFAELTDLPRPGRPAVTWDSPEDTAAIHLGFGLAATPPLTRATLCGAIGPARSSLDSVATCDDCAELTPSKIR